MEKSAPTGSNTGSTSGSVAGNSLLEQLYNNKTYLYIVIAVIVLAGIGFYLYKKQMLGNKSEKKEEKEKPKQEGNKEILLPNKEYYLVDPNGNPVLVNKYFAKIMQSEMQEQSNQNNSVMLNNQIPLPPPPSQVQMRQQQRPAQRPKLSHPGEEEIEQVNITEREDDNVANQDLTQAEIDELRKQLEMMQRKQVAPITAQNDGNNDEAEF